MERGICPIATLALRLNLYSLTGSRVWPLGSLDVIGHVTTGWSFPIRSLLMPSHYLAPLPRYWASNMGHDLDPFGSRDVIGHVAIGTAVGHFLLVIRWHHVPNLHHCRDIEHQTFRGHDLDPFGSREVISHVTIGTADGHFLLVVHWHHVPILYRCRDIEHQTFS